MADPPRDVLRTPRFGKTHVIAAGDPAAPPLVLLHPAAVAGLVWAPIIEPLSRSRRVYTLDTIGELGRSSFDDHDRYAKSGQDFSGWLRDVYTALDLHRADVIGGSAGGWIALQHAIHAPEQVNRLVVIGPMGLPSWRSTLGVLGPLLSMALRPTDAKLDALTLRGIGYR